MKTILAPPPKARVQVKAARTAVSQARVRVHRLRQEPPAQAPPPARVQA